MNYNFCVNLKCYSYLQLQSSVTVTRDVKEAKPVQTLIDVALNFVSMTFLTS